MAKISQLGIPASYDYINFYNATMEPSTVHVKNTGLSNFFTRYLVQKAISAFEWEGIPETWAVNYFLYSLFIFGHVAVIETDKFGVIPQHCGLYGYDVMYQPTHATIANPLLSGIKQPRIGLECEVIKLEPDYGGIWDLVSFYADMLALSAETAGVNLVNSKLSFIFLSKNKAAAESFKKLYDQIASGQPAAFIDKDLLDEDGNLSYQLFNQNLQQNYIAGQIIQDMVQWDCQFNTAVGIPNVNIAKLSGVSGKEVDANNIDTECKAILWEETMKKGVEAVNKMFGLDISVRYKYRREEIQNVDINSIDVRTLSGNMG